MRTSEIYSQFSCSVMSHSLWPPGLHAASQASLSITNSWSLLRLMSIKSVMPSNHLTLCHPLLLLPSIFPSIRVFSNESVLRIRWPKFWSQLQQQSFQWIVSEIAQLCPTFCDPVDCDPPGSSVHGILQARILEWVAISFSNEYSGLISFRIDWFTLLVTFKYAI